MIRKLLIGAAACTGLSLVCLTGAAALVSHDLSGNGWNLTLDKDGQRGVHFTHGKAAGPVATAQKTLPWAGGDTLTIASDAPVDYVQGDAASVVISGPQAAIDRVHLDNNRLYMTDDTGHEETLNLHLGPDGFTARSDHGEVKIVVTAPSVTHFNLSGDGDLHLTNYNQPTLGLTLSGSGGVDANGHTDAVKVELSGSGDADLSNLAAKDADVSISGDGDTDLAATGAVTADISGSGDLNLKTKPQNVSSHISGTGSLDQE